MSEEPGESWYTYRRLVLEKLQDVKNEMESTNDKIDRLRADVIMLKVKSSVWGAVAGAVFSTIVSGVITLYESIHIGR